MVDILIHSQLYLDLCILICLLTIALAEMYTPVTHILPELEKKIRRLNLTLVSPSKKGKLWWQCWPLPETYAWKPEKVKTHSQSSVFRETEKDYPSHAYSKKKTTSTTPQSHLCFMKHQMILMHIKVWEELTWKTLSLVSGKQTPSDM